MITLKAGEKLIIFNRSFESFMDEVDLVKDDKNDKVLVKLDMTRYIYLWEFHIKEFMNSTMKIKKLIPLDVGVKKPRKYSLFEQKLFEEELFENIVLTVYSVDKENKVIYFIPYNIENNVFIRKLNPTNISDLISEFKSIFDKNIFKNHTFLIQTNLNIDIKDNIKQLYKNIYLFEDEEYKIMIFSNKDNEDKDIIMAVANPLNKDSYKYYPYSFAIPNESKEVKIPRIVCSKRFIKREEEN